MSHDNTSHDSMAHELNDFSSAPKRRGWTRKDRFSGSEETLQDQEAARPTDNASTGPSNLDDAEEEGGVASSTTVTAPALHHLNVVFVPNNVNRVSRLLRDEHQRWAVIAIIGFILLCFAIIVMSILACTLPRHDHSFDVSLDRYQDETCDSNPIGNRAYIREGQCHSWEDNLTFKAFHHHVSLCCPKISDRGDIESHTVQWAKNSTYYQDSSSYGDCSIKAWMGANCTGQYIERPVVCLAVAVPNETC